MKLNNKTTIKCHTHYCSVTYISKNCIKKIARNKKNSNRQSSAIWWCFTFIALNINFKFVKTIYFSITIQRVSLKSNGDVPLKHATISSIKTMFDFLWGNFVDFNEVLIKHYDSAYQSEQFSWNLRSSQLIAYF